MKFTTTKSEILGSLQRAASVASSKGTLPILEHLLIEVQHTHGRITASDLEIQVVSLPEGIRTETEGRVCIPAKKVHDIVKLLPDGDISFTLTGEKLSIKSGKSRYSISTLPAENFPAFDRGDVGQTVVVSAETLRNAIRKTRYAMAQNDVRYYLNGMALQVENGIMRTVASDGHRLAFFESGMPDLDTQTPLVIVPPKGIDEIAKLCAEALKNDAEAEITLSVGSSSISADYNGIVIASKLIEGKFPDYNRVIPKQFTTELFADAKELNAAVNRVSVVSDDKTSAVLVEVTESAINLRASHSGSEEAEDVVASMGFDGKKASAAFTASYLSDALAAVSGTDASIKLTDTGIAVISDTTDDSWLCVVMPRRV
jgi:DNA polymerase-3 subunit beta